jgi:phenylalanyl-tRNA synthetase beta chain
MQLPESWLRAYCNPPLASAELAEVLTMGGLEVEEMRPAAPPFSRIVVGEIVAAEPHPNADKLRVCQVLAGAHTPDGPLQIVCGAPNARAGLKAPLALVGAQLPPAEEGGAPFVIKPSVLRGVESAGMLCSARELQLSQDHGGLLELPADATPGSDMRALLALDDQLFTLKLTPNLAHLLSVYGVAREVAALTGAPLIAPQFTPVAPTIADTLPVRIDAPDLCGRFSGRIVRGVNPQAPTPAWMVERLARCGQRSVSALVDISNYVMFEFGRPSHIFDLDKIHERLVVRWAQPGETLELLNGSTVELDGEVGVIADARGVESLAGIMGGERTAVGDATRNIYIEAAFWWPQAVQGRSRRYGFATDAGHRFERGVDPAQTVEHIERLTQLVIEICGGQAGPMDDQVVNLPQRTPVTLRVARAAKVIGMPLTQAQCAQALRALALPVEEGDGTLSVRPPSWRFDLTLEEDLIEEVARLVGYRLLPATPPVAPVTASALPEARRPVHALRHALAALDYQETVSFSFVEERWERELAGNADPIRVLNPIAAPLAVMRSSLVGSLVGVLRHNLARKAARVRVFEVGRVFARDASVADGPLAVAGVAQPLKIAALAYGSAVPLQWGQPERGVDFYDAKGDVEALLAPRRACFVAAEHPALHPGRSARVDLDDGRTIGWVGELHPRWRQAYELPHAPVLFELDALALAERDVPAYAGVPRQQAVQRDLSLVLPERVSHDALIACIVSDDTTGLVRSARLFDLYKPKAAAAGIGAHERSLSVRIELLDDSATLTDERIDATMATIVARLRDTLDARLRA